MNALLLHYVNMLSNIKYHVQFISMQRSKYDKYETANTTGCLLLKINLVQAPAPHKTLTMKVLHIFRFQKHFSK